MNFYELGVLIHCIGIGVPLISLWLFAVYQLIVCFINDIEPRCWLEKYSDRTGFFRHYNTDDLPFECFICTVCSIGIPFLIGVCWPAIYLIGFPIGLMFGLRSLNRRLKSSSTKLETKIKEAINDHERVHHA